MRQSNLVWTDEKCEQLTSLWGTKLSASQIATQLGAGFTRSAVLGKARRLELPSRPRKKSEKTSPPKKRDKPSRFTSMGRQAFFVAPAPKLPVKPVAKEVPPLEDADIPPEQRRTLSTVTEETCHWPVGDPASPDFFFCGGKSVKGSSYCASHARAAYQPVRSRHARRAA